jgi:hypothetical protein
MPMLHPCHGSIPQYEQELSDPDRYRPDRCPLATPQIRFGPMAFIAALGCTSKTFENGLHLAHNS